MIPKAGVREGLRKEEKKRITLMKQKTQLLRTNYIILPFLADFNYK